MVVTMLLVWTLMIAAVETPIGRMMRAGFVAAPARLLEPVGRGHVLLVAMIAAGMGGLVWLIGEESVRLLAMGAPEMMSWIVMIDAASLIDAAVAVVMVAGAVRIETVKTRIAARWRRIARPRAVRSRPARRESGANDADPDSNDSADAPRWAVAA